MDAVLNILFNNLREKNTKDKEENNHDAPSDSRWRLFYLPLLL